MGWPAPTSRRGGTTWNPSWPAGRSRGRWAIPATPSTPSCRSPSRALIEPSTRSRSSTPAAPDFRRSERRSLPIGCGSPRQRGRRDRRCRTGRWERDVRRRLRVSDDAIALIRRACGRRVTWAATPDGRGRVRRAAPQRTPRYAKAEPIFTDALTAVRRLLWGIVFFEQPRLRRGVRKRPPPLRRALFGDPFRRSGRS